MSVSRIGPIRVKVATMPELGRTLSSQAEGSKLIIISNEIFFCAIAKVWLAALFVKYQREIDEIISFAS